MWGKVIWFESFVLEEAGASDGDGCYWSLAWARGGSPGISLWVHCGTKRLRQQKGTSTGFCPERIPSNIRGSLQGQDGAHLWDFVPVRRTLTLDSCADTS